MSSTLKPRVQTPQLSYTGVSGSTTTAAAAAAAAGAANDQADNEKEVKIRQHQMAKFQQFLFLFFLLSIVAFILGNSQSGIHNNIHNNTASIRNTINNNANGGQSIPLTNDNAAAAAVVADSGPSLEELQAHVNELDEQVRQHKAKPNMIIETDPTGMKLTKELQHATHQLLVKRYGTAPKRVVVDLIFPSTMPDYTEETKHGKFIIEMAPHELIPCSVFYYLEIARTWKSGSIHRNANHVLQIQSRSDMHKSMPFQEYSPEFPHKKYTTGYAGRPSGPGWYVSIMDNTKNHGPGSQQQHNPHEADANFGKVVQGVEDGTISRIHTVPQKGWLDKDHQIQIPKLTILTPKYEESTGRILEWVPWKEE